MVANADSDNPEGCEQVILSGDLTIRRARELKEQLVRASSRGTSVVMRLEQVTECDLSFLQMVCALHRSMAREGREIFLQGAGATVFRHAVVAAGYQDCMAGRDRQGIWKGV